MTLPPRPGLRECFDVLVELAEPERAAWLDANVPEADTRTLLRQLLEADRVDDAAVPVLRAGAAALATQFLPEFDDGSRLVGTQIGPYRLTAVLGHGGTAVVFRAERPIGDGVQVVALKLLRSGVFSADGQRRFRREQGVLSQLSHPNIASLIDGGMAADGTPYIAMEFVDGLPLTAHAQAHALDLAARLRLLITVCRAVDSAHRNLVVHRDLKPSNTLVNRDGEVKVLDFGIAQMLDTGAGEAAHTQVIALTPGYAAPEQYAPGAVTTAADVYSLGILLGELLTGTVTGPAVHTSSLSRVFAEQRHAAPHGLSPAPALRRLLRGDLDAIHGCACATEPERRYGSAAAFAEDLERYLAKRPIKARAPSLRYRFGKYIRRNRVATGAAALALLAIVLGASVALWQARVAREESRHAAAVSDFLMGLFDASKAGQLPEQRLTLEQVVQRAHERLPARTDIADTTRIDMLRMLGEVSAAASDYQQAEQLFDEALDLSLRSYAIEAPVPTRLRLLQANLLLLRNRYAAAARSYEALLPHIRHPRDEFSIGALQNYAASLMYSARTDEALAISADAAHAARDFHGGTSQPAAIAALTHGGMLVSAARPVEAAAEIEGGLRQWRSAAWPPSAEFLQGLGNLARARRALGQLDVAEQLARERLATAETIYPAGHKSIGDALRALGEILLEQARLDEAETALQRALSLYRTLEGRGKMREANTLTSLGALALRRGNVTRADDDVRLGQQWCARADLHPTRTCLEHDLLEAQIALERADLQRADAASARGLATAKAIFGDAGDETAALVQLRAAIELANGNAAAALDLCDRARAMLVGIGAHRGSIAVAVAMRRAEALEALHRHAEALQEVDAALSTWRQLAPTETRRHSAMVAARARLHGKLVGSAPDTMAAKSQSPGEK